MVHLPPWLNTHLLQLPALEQTRVAACLSADIPLEGRELSPYAAEGVVLLLRRGWSPAQILERGQAALQTLVGQETAWEQARAHALEWWLTPQGTDYLALLDAGIHLGGDPWALIEARWGWRPDPQTAAGQLSAYWWLTRQDALAARSGGSGKSLTHEDLRLMLSQPYTIRDQLAVMAMRRQASSPTINHTETHIEKALKEGLLT